MQLSVSNMWNQNHYDQNMTRSMQMMDINIICIGTYQVGPGVMYKENIYHLHAATIHDHACKHETGKTPNPCKPACNQWKNICFVTMFDYPSSSSSLLMHLMHKACSYVPFNPWIKQLTCTSHAYQATAVHALCFFYGSIMPWNGGERWNQCCVK